MRKELVTSCCCGYFLFLRFDTVKEEAYKEMQIAKPKTWEFFRINNYKWPIKHIARTSTNI